MPALYRIPFASSNNSFSSNIAFSVDRVGWFLKKNRGNFIYVIIYFMRNLYFLIFVFHKFNKLQNLFINLQMIAFFLFMFI